MGRWGHLSRRATADRGSGNRAEHPGGSSLAGSTLALSRVEVTVGKRAVFSGATRCGGGVPVLLKGPKGSLPQLPRHTFTLPTRPQHTLFVKSEALTSRDTRRSLLLH